jgi:L-lactate dehydrogenase complex protein LldG
MSAARSAVLDALRAVRVPDAPRPAPMRFAPLRQDLEEPFRVALEAAGGSCASAPDRDALERVLAGLAAECDAHRIASAVPELAGAGIDLDADLTRTELASIDLAVLPGQFAVAENGAVWVDVGALRHRAAPFLAEHLVLVVPAGAIEPDLHAAYDRLTFAGPGYGVFVAGPSKTADIEQALVIGAHGSRSTTVVLVG